MADTVRPTSTILWLLGFAAAVGASPRAAADSLPVHNPSGPLTLRMAAVAPEGTGWARELHNLSVDVGAETHDNLRMKWYLGGVAGDELAAVERVRRGQLDGLAGAIFCDRLAPSLKVMRVIGLLRSRAEVAHVIGHLRKRFDPEFEKSGFVQLGVSTFGNDILFSRDPVRSLGDLQKNRMWIWKLDDVWGEFLHGIGVQTFATDLPEAGRAFDNKMIDGYIAIPSAALAFQWSTRVGYFTEMNAGFLPACIVLSQAAWQRLTREQHDGLLAAAARFFSRFEGLQKGQDDALIRGGLFEKQGLHPLPMSETFRTEFFSAAREARERMGKLVGVELLREVNGWLADYRAEHDRPR